MVIETYLVDRILEGNVVSAVEINEMDSLILNMLLIIFGTMAFPKSTIRAIVYVVHGEEVKTEIRNIQERTDWKILRIHRDTMKQIKNSEQMRNKMENCHVIVTTDTQLLSLIKSGILSWNMLNHLIVKDSAFGLNMNSNIRQILGAYCRSYEDSEAVPYVFLNCPLLYQLNEDTYRMAIQLESLCYAKFMNPYQCYQRDVKFLDKRVLMAEQEFRYVWKVIGHGKNLPPVSEVNIECQLEAYNFEVLLKINRFGKCTIPYTDDERNSVFDLARQCKWNTLETTIQAAIQDRRHKIQCLDAMIAFKLENEIMIISKTALFNEPSRFQYAVLSDFVKKDESGRYIVKGPTKNLKVISLFFECGTLTLPMHIEDLLSLCDDASFFWINSLLTKCQNELFRIKKLIQDSIWFDGHHTAQQPLTQQCAPLISVQQPSPQNPVLIPSTTPPLQATQTSFHHSVIIEVPPEKSNLPLEHFHGNSQVFGHLPRILLRNVSNDCFVICIVQLVYGIDSIRSGIIKHGNEDGVSDVIKELHNIFTSLSDNVRALREKMDNIYRTGQHDSKVAYDFILSAIPDSLFTDISLSLITEVTCEVCECSNQNTVKVADAFSILQKGSITIEEAFAPTLAPIFCEVCSMWTALEKATYCVLPTTKFCILKVYKKFKDFKITNLHIEMEDGFDFIGEVWKIHSFVEYVPSLAGQFGALGHYNYWEQVQGKGWRRLSDDVEEYYSTIDIQDMDISIIVFKRV